MSIAALPDHNRLDDPLWRQLFHAYRHLITPLRYNGWTTDVETGGGEFFIRADLADGTELVIASTHSLPNDPAKVTGWNALRRHTDDPARHTVLYDSTHNGPQRHHGNSLIPLFARIDQLDAAKSGRRLIVSTTHTAPFGASRAQAAGHEPAATAIARYFEVMHQHTTDHGYCKVWERPATGGHPLALFEREGHVAILRVTAFGT
ncbi:hypothetical protein [Streptomyces fractus]|uniref:hypothetical protein n=1 Tax=Streptomyces fractus TaxID=641806 RepID=UPI003CEEFF1C